MFVELMQALFSTMPETTQQPMTDFRRLCLEAEENKEKDAYRNLQKTLDKMGVTLIIKSQKG